MGDDQWQRLAKAWQNLRATREMELLGEGLPLHAVCAWIGNTPEVVMKSYLRIRAEHRMQAIDGPTYAGKMDDALRKKVFADVM